MTRLSTRVIAAALAAGISGALLVSSGPPAAAFDAGPLASVVNGVVPSSTSGTNFEYVQLSAPEACDAAATRHVTKITSVTATNPADQTLADAWVGDNLYATASHSLPGPLTVQASNSWQGLADGYGQQLVPGDYRFTLRCQNNFGTVLYEEWSGGVTFTSPTAWHANVLAAPLVATTTAVTASPQPVTSQQNVTLAATVSESDPADPTGTVEFFDGATPLGSASVNTSGVATLVGPLAAGTYDITGVYSGDATFATSTGAAPTGFVVSTPTTPPPDDTPTPAPPAPAPSDPPPPAPAPVVPFVDAGVPKASLTGPGATTVTGSTRVTWTGSDNVGVASFDLRQRTAAWNKPLGGYVYPAQQQKTTARSVSRSVALGALYCFSVRARDAAGNVSPWSSERCTARPLDDRSLTSKGAWSKGKGSSYFAGTIATATAKGATLTRKGALPGRVALVASKGKGFGKVGIYYNGKKVKTVSLAAKKKATRTVIALPKLAKAGTIQIKVLSTGKTVQVDGIVSARR